MLLEAFITQCRLQPAALAVQDEARQLSYQQLLQQASCVGMALRAAGVQPGQRVAIQLERGIDGVLAVFGVLLAGGCYVPLDLKNPPARLAFIIADADVALVLGRGEAPDWLSSVGWLDLQNCLADDGDAERAADLTNNGGLLPLDQPAPQDNAALTLAAILYTSGSTGQPRGVALSHRAIAAFADWAAVLLRLTPADRIASSAPLFFDLSTFDLYAVLGRGGSLHFLPTALNMAPAKLSTWLAQRRISGWYSVPSLLAFLAYKGNLSQTPLPALRFLLFAGEVFPTPAVIELAGHLPHTELYNLFGPTETNVCCYWRVEPQRLNAGQAIPIGIPAAGCELQVDPDSGELLVRGPTLASGYWHAGALKDFLNEHGWYATGDRVSLQAGAWHFHGRLGRMLKCSGYRVEPAEIEAAVSAIAGVERCAVVGIEDAAAGQRPGLALCLAANVGLADIRKVLAQRLPAYMQPSRYLIVDALPVLANGKLDYQALRQMFSVSDQTALPVG